MKYIKQHDLITCSQLAKAYGVDRTTITRALQRFCKDHLIDHESVRLGREFVVGPKLLSEFHPWYQDQTTRSIKQYKSVDELLKTAQRMSHNVGQIKPEVG